MENIKFGRSLAKDPETNQGINPCRSMDRGRLKEAEILRRLNLEQGMVFQQKTKQQQPIAAQSLAVFQRPHEWFIKLNFDGVTKGNPGLARYGGIFRKSQGDT